MKEYYQLLPVRPESDFLRHFLKVYHADLQRIMPDFNYRPAEKQLTLFILRDCTPVGVLIAEHKTRRRCMSCWISSSRAIATCIGRFLFVEQAEYFRMLGVKEIVIQPRTKEFKAYLVEVGFETDGSQAGRVPHLGGAEGEMTVTFNTLALWAEGQLGLPVV